MLIRLPVCAFLFRVPASCRSTCSLSATRLRSCTGLIQASIGSVSATAPSTRLSFCSATTVPQTSPVRPHSKCTAATQPCSRALSMDKSPLHSAKRRQMDGCEGGQIDREINGWVGVCKLGVWVGGWVGVWVYW